MKHFKDFGKETWRCTLDQPSEQQPPTHPAGMTSGRLELKLLVRGFSKTESQLLDAIVLFSHRRLPKITLVAASHGETANVVMIDFADAEAKKWASEQAWLKNKPVIWVDAPEAPGRTVVQRPVNWSALPALLARVLEQPGAENTPRLPSPSGNKSVLVVDDSFAMRSQLRGLLERRGLAVTEVESAEAAVQAAANAAYACILMDVLLPGIDGYEACRQIKANVSGGNRPVVVMLTSKTSPFDRIRGKMAGCDAYLTKPVEEDRLYEVISRYIATPAAANPAPGPMPPPRFA